VGDARDAVKKAADLQIPVPTARRDERPRDARCSFVGVVCSWALAAELRSAERFTRRYG